VSAPRFLLGWALLTAAASAIVYARSHIALAPMPSQAAQRWAMRALSAAGAGAPLPDAPPDAVAYRAAGSVIALAWFRGVVRARYVGDGDFAGSVRRAAARFAANPALRALSRRPGAADNPVRFTLSVPRGAAPLLLGVPFLSNLSVVPLVEGVSAELGGQHAYLTPEELLGDDLFDHVRTPIPDLTIGIDIDRIVDMLGRELGVDGAHLARAGSLRRFRAGIIAANAYPTSPEVDVPTLERAAREGAQFLLRHQGGDGRYTYVYDGRTGKPDATQEYNLPRHAGTTYFLAQAARVLGMPEARAGALRAMRWLREESTTTCGAPDRLCVRTRDRADMGSSALAALAAAELLRSGDDAETRAYLRGLTAFIRSMQRPDGELKHLYDLNADRAVDVQRMYYSGEAADALLYSHRVLGDPADLAAAQRVMRHLTGAGWDFFGSRYFYGEEHWTCQAVAQALDVAGDAAGLPFCLRWLGYQRALLYPAGQTPWPVQGAIGVGPVILPRLTTVASRVEAGAMLYPLVRARGLADADDLRAQVESSLGLLLRMRWAPGPAHLLYDAKAAFGGVPASQAGLQVRNDYVQHACSAMLTWVEVLRSEQR
jgi:hypothetical protein